MKKIILLLLITLTTYTNFAQNMNRDRVKLLKASYITDALNLTVSEAEKFWPIYNSFNDKTERLKNLLEIGLNQELIEAGGIDNLTDTQAQKFVDKALQLEQEIVDSKKLMVKELRKILPPKKIIKLQKVEHEFNRRLLLEYGKRKRLMMGQQ